MNTQVAQYNAMHSFLVNSKPLTMSSLKIAEFTGKNHFDVMRDIRKIEEQLGDSKFALSSYRSHQNKELPMYELDEEQSICLVSGYDVKIRMAIIKEWKALKEAHDPLAIMGTMNSNQITLFARTAVELAKEVKQKENALEQIEEQQPKVEFYDEVVDSTGYVDWNEAAKQLGYGRNTMLETLRRAQILQGNNGKRNSRNSSKKNMPYQYTIDQGYFVVKMVDTGFGFKSQTFVTGKGMAWLQKKMKQREVLH